MYDLKDLHGKEFGAFLDNLARRVDGLAYLKADAGQMNHREAIEFIEELAKRINLLTPGGIELKDMTKLDGLGFGSFG
jgi:hypothetical protein